MRGVTFDIGWRSTRILQGSLPQVPFVLALLLGATVACGAAVLVGLGALRVKGLLLGVSTLAFAIAAQAYIFARPIFTGSLNATTVQLPRGSFGPVDLSHLNRAYYYFTLAALVVVLVLVGHLRRTGVGRRIIGVRENEPAASALTVSPRRARLTSFAVAGFVAGLGGAILGGLVVTIGFTERFFRVEDSLQLVAVAVIGGLGSLAGAVMGALWVIGLPAFWPKNQTVPLFTSSIGLLIILLYIPGGFIQIGYWFRGSLLNWLEKRLPAPETKTINAPPASVTRAAGRATAPVDADADVLTTTGLSVHFHGVVAVDGVDFRAGPGEVIGLIGTNGAGKSTLLNAIGGYVPSSGSVEILGHDASSLPAHRRSRLGLGRTFQAATLFPELTVRETVQLALEARRRDIVLGLAALAPARDAGRADEARRGGRAHRLPRSRSLRRPLHRRALDGHTPHRRAHRAPRGGAPGDLPRRAHRRRRPTGGRGVRSAHQAGAAGTRRHVDRGRARPPADPLDLGPGLLHGGGEGDRRGFAAGGARTTRSSSPRTWGPTSGRSGGATPTSSPPKREDTTMSRPFAPDAAVDTWREQGWVVLEGLVETEAIDAAVEDLAGIFPTPEAYHADPVGVTEQWLGRPPPEREAFVWPPDGPGFRPEQHRWQHLFPFPGSGALNRLCVHPAIVDFMERALGSDDLRLYQSMALAKYTGITNYEQPMHTDRNHSLLPPLTEPPWQHVESFLYLSDVGPDTAPTHLVPVGESVGRSPTVPLVDAGRRPRAVRRRATRDRSTGLVARVSARRLPPRGRSRRTGSGAVPAERELQARGSGLDRLPRLPVPRELDRVGRVRGGVDVEGARAVRVPPSGASRVGPGAARRDRAPVSGARPHAVARRALSTTHHGGGAGRRTALRCT